MKIFMAGQKVPSWLEKVEPTGKGEFNPYYSFTFTNPTIVYIKNDQYHVRSIIGGDSIMTIKNMSNANVIGQPAIPGGGGVVLEGKPILRWSNLLLIGFCSLILFLK